MAKKKKTGRKKTVEQKQKNNPGTRSALVDKTNQIAQEDKKQQEKRTSKKNKAQELEKTTYIEQLSTFFKEVKAEFKKITWATKKETVATTVVVLAITFFFAAYLGLVDIVFSKIISLLLY